jgi:hypothetical protein
MTDNEKCGKCGASDFTPSGNCRPCKKAANAAYRVARAAGGGNAVKTKPKTAAKKSVEVSATPQFSDLVIERGYGLTATVDEDYLIVAQHDGETGKDDKVCLSRSELRALFATFGKWAAITC